jgi:hypothetical protein
MLSCLKDWVEVIKNIVEIVAVVLGGVVAYRRIRSGDKIVNLSLDLKCERAKGKPRPGKDLLGVALVITRGDRSAVRIHDVEVRINGQPAPWKAVWREQLLRFTSVEQQSHVPPYFKISWGAPSATAPFVNLPPDEETQVSNYCEVDSESACHVEAVLLGVEIKSGKRSQWRASAVSLPS